MLSWVRTLNCPLFLNWQMEITRFWLLHSFDWKRAMPLLPIPGSRDWLGFPLTGGRTLNCPLFLNWADGNHPILAAPFLRLEAPNASPTHPWKPQPAWLFLYQGANLKLSAFRIGRDRKTPAFLKQKADRFPTNHVRSSEIIDFSRRQKRRTRQNCA